MVAFVTSITSVQRCFVATTGKDLPSYGWQVRLRRINILHFVTVLNPGVL